MAETILKKDAEKVLLSAFRKRCTKKDIISDKILAILESTHKTYKYILINGLLAKATNEKINALALQARAPLEGAYDARSLCHNVLVPFERDFLHNALGGSNEPFLNKPARFTHLSNKNAVRKGQDKKTLELLIDIFNSIHTSSEAKNYLSCALDFLSKEIEENKLRHNSLITYNPTLIEIYELIISFLEKSLEGETIAITVATLEKMYYSRLSKKFSVVAHKVNQSGASSKETGDIDIFEENHLSYAIEVKDKKFSVYDLEHAIKKIQKKGGTKGQFIYGQHALFDKKQITQKISDFEKEGFMILFQDVYTYAKTILFKIDLENKQEFVDTLIKTSIEINAKSTTTNWIHDLLNNLEWKNL